MRKHEGYDLIGRYLDGDLPPEAAREFEMLLEHDRELAEEVRSEQMIRETFDQDIAAMPVASNEPSALLVAKLEATSVAAGGAIGAGTGGGLLGTIFGTVGGVTIVTTVGLIGLALGAIFFSESIETVEMVDQPIPVEKEADPVLHSEPAGADLPRPSVGNPESSELPDTRESAEEDGREENASTRTSSSRQSSVNDRTPPRDPVDRFAPPSPIDHSTTTSARQEDPVRALLERLQKEDNREVPVTREDSVLKIRKDS